MEGHHLVRVVIRCGFEKFSPCPTVCSSLHSFPDRVCTISYYKPASISDKLKPGHWAARFAACRNAWAPALSAGCPFPTKQPSKSKVVIWGLGGQTTQLEERASLGIRVGRGFIWMGFVLSRGCVLYAPCPPLLLAKFLGPTLGSLHFQAKTNPLTFWSPRQSGRTSHKRGSVSNYGSVANKFYRY